MYRIFLIISVFLISCSSFSKKSEQGKDDINFNTFIKEFSSDSSYQVSRIVFPLLCESYSEELDAEIITKKIDKGDWTCLSFEESDSYQLSVDSISSVDTIKVILTGVETGVYITYYFCKSNQDWKLVKIFDESN